MTLKEQLYTFDSLEIHSAIIFQSALDGRRTNITRDGIMIKAKEDKSIKAVLDEIDQIYDDLDRHIAAQVRLQERSKQKSTEPANDVLFRQTIGK